MANETPIGMDKAVLKQLLMKSMKEPVNCAIGRGADANLGLIRLDRIKQPKVLLAELTKQVPEATTTRFGTAFVDTNDDPKLVKFIINKAVSGMARRLVKSLKGTGFSKVQILLDDGSVVEVADDENEAASDVASLPVPERDDMIAALTVLVRRIPEAVAADPSRKEALTAMAIRAQASVKQGNLSGAQADIEALRSTLDQVPVASDTNGPKTPAASSPDGDTRVRELTALVRRIGEAIAMDPACKPALMVLATQAQANLKGGNLTEAAVFMERLQRALDNASAGTAAATARLDADAIRRALAQFEAAQSAVDDQISQLQAELRGSDDPELRSIAEFGMNGLTGDTKVKLQAAIMQLRASLPAADTKLAGMASRLAEQMAAHLAESRKVSACDNNPFGVPVTIAATLGGAARQLHDVLRQAA